MATTTPPNDRMVGRASVGRAQVPTAPPPTPGYGAPGGPIAPVRGVQYGGGKGPRRGPRWGRIALVAGLAVLLVAGLGATGAWVYYRQINAGLDRSDPFSEITGGRPAKVVDGALNILMLGSDSRDPDANANGPSQWRTDTMIIMHIPASHDKAYLISLPRDLYVHIPKSADGKYGNTMAKINASYAWGGLPLTVRTVEGFTGVRMDHVVMIDFGGFKQIIDALGGIDMNVEQTIKSIHKPFRTFKKGTNHFNGEEALDYVRQRYQFPDADFARMRHQQQMMKAVMDKAASSGTLTDPRKLHAFLKATAAALTVDKGFSLADMALQFRNIRSENLTFLVSPHLGGQTVNGESVVVSDKTKAVALYQAVKTDKVADWVAQHAAPTPKPSGSTKSGG
jgi:LCP family protein required for cell wall assembly